MPDELRLHLAERLVDDLLSLSPAHEARREVCDARLRDAAPDLLAALKEISDALVTYDDECQRVFAGRVSHAGRCGRQLMAVIRAIESSRAAIAKAESRDEAHTATTSTKCATGADQ